MVLIPFGSLWARHVRAGETLTEEGRTLLRERYAALRRQIPLIYGIALADFAAFRFATANSLIPALWPGGILILVIMARLAFWLLRRPETLEPEQILVRLQRVQLIAMMLSLSFGIWGIVIFQGGTQAEQNYVILFGSLSATTCAYGLGSFPNAARLPLIFLAFPLAAHLILTGEKAMMGLGICLILAIALIMRLLSVQEQAFRQLVRTRSAIAHERTRAVDAERRASAEQERVRTIAYTDHLTGLPNRRAYIEALEAFATGRNAPTARRCAIAMLDLDGFKPINDTFGHPTGDAILRQVGERLKAVIDTGDMVARIGGDEFAFLLPNCASEAAADGAGARIMTALCRPFMEGDREFRLSGGCGLAMVDAGMNDAPLAMVQADAALYEAKQRGRGEVTLYCDALEEKRRRRTDIANALRASAIHDEIRPVFQPIYDLSSMTLLSFEALARWKHETLGDLSPAEFIPIAEQLNLIEQISDALLAKAVDAASHWPDVIRLSVNLSAVQLCSRSTGRKILSMLERVGMDPSRINIEVTETALLVDFETARENLALLKAEGSRIVIDDFGAGYASIAYLRELHFDAVKLDGSLIAPIVDSPASRRLLKGVLDLCASLRTPCVAEHIETREQLLILNELGCPRGQGYLLGAPGTAEETYRLAVSTVRQIRSAG